MATTDKNFRVKNGLNVAGNATFDSNIILGDSPLRFDTVTNKLQIQLNGTWSPIAFISDIPDTANMLTFMDIGLSIDYNGQPTYIIQANGIVPTGTNKFLDAGTESTTSWSMEFDAGVIQ